ncbi:hypothetical protein ABKV19_001296 [Rosa sericea]
MVMDMLCQCLGRWRNESRNKVSSMSRTAGRNPFWEAQPEGHISETSNSRVFSYRELKTATKNFQGLQEMEPIRLSRP